MSLLLALAMLICSISIAAADSTVYLGSAPGFGDAEVSAEVTVEDGRVTALTIDDSTQSYQLNGVESLQPLVDAILAAGGTEGVDVVSNATVSNNAVLAIVNDALSGGPVDYTGVEITYAPVPTPAPAVAGTARCRWRSPSQKTASLPSAFCPTARPPASPTCPSRRFPRTSSPISPWAWTQSPVRP